MRWYLDYNQSLRDLEEMMAERSIAVDHTTIHRWTVRFSPLLLERFNWRKQTVTGKLHVDETYIKVHGQWMYLYRAIDRVGAAKRFFRRVLKRHGRSDRVVIDGSQTNGEAIISCDTTHRLQEHSRRQLHRHPAPSLAGGEPGAPGRLSTSNDEMLQPKLTRTLPRDTVVSIEIPDGGGFGDPMRRDPEAVRHDVRAGYVSLAAAERVYGVAIDPVRGAVDPAHTAAPR